MSTDPVLSVRGLKKWYPIESGPLRRVTGHVKAVDDVSFDVARGEVLALVGESGCGKTTLGSLRSSAPSTPRRATAILTAMTRTVDLATADRATLRRLRRRHEHGVSGPVLVAVAADDGARHHRRAAARPGDPPGSRSPSG